MPNTAFSYRRSSRFPLAVRLSLLLILAAVLPLILTVGITEYTTSLPDLTTQANQAMTTDATTRIQEIDAYLRERLLDAETLSQVGSTQSYMAEPDAIRATDLSGAQHAGYALAAGEYRDKNYLVWMLFSSSDTPVLEYPTNIQAHQYGQTLVPPEEWQAVQHDKTGQAFFSPVYYDPSTKKAFIDIYSPIYQNGNPSDTFLGFMRASLSLNYIWNILNSDKGMDNQGGALLLDQNGVRIAQTNTNTSSFFQSAHLFTAVQQPSPTISQQMMAEEWYGTTNAIAVQANPALASSLSHSQTGDNFTLTLTPNGQEYQAASYEGTVLPWTYVVLNPTGVVTQVANRQLLITLIAAAAVAVLAAIAGWLISNRLSRPIMRSVEQLQESSEALNNLAKKQQSASSEQLWVVDSIQVGLQSVQYYTDATRIAAHKLGEIGTELERNWRRQQMETIKQGLQQIISTADYIGKASNFQGDSSQKLATAVKVTTQVNEQLADGAISATEAASQLEQVVSDLRHVLGK